MDSSHENNPELLLEYVFKSFIYLSVEHCSIHCYALVILSSTCSMCEVISGLSRVWLVMFNMNGYKR